MQTLRIIYVVVAGGFLGAVVAAVVIGIVWGLLDRPTYRYGGGEWIIAVLVLGIIGGISVGWREMVRKYGQPDFVESNIARAGVVGRIWLVLSALWMVSTATVLWVFNPFGYYWYQAAWTKAAIIVIGPVVVAGAGVLLVGWALRSGR